MSRAIPKVTCDGCGADVTATGNSVDYRLTLHAESLPAWWQLEGEGGGMCTNMMIYPAVKKPLHFCNNIACVQKWLAKTFPSTGDSE